MIEDAMQEELQTLRLRLRREAELRRALEVLLAARDAPSADAAVTRGASEDFGDIQADLAAAMAKRQAALRETWFVEWAATACRTALEESEGRRVKAITEPG